MLKINESLNENSDRQTKRVNEAIYPYAGKQ
jgi:hypothetical protein